MTKFSIDLPDNLFQIFKIKSILSFLPFSFSVRLSRTLLTLVRYIVGLVQTKNNGILHALHLTDFNKLPKPVFFVRASDSSIRKPQGEATGSHMANL